MTRYVLHVDLDQFIAAVEVLRRPELRGKPVVVGGDGDPSKRGVVMTASYEARRFGVGSAMPLRTAYRKLPEAVFLPADPDAYRAASGEVMNTLRTFPGTLEVAGWDEAFLEADTEDPEALARDIQTAVLDKTGLHCSVGIGDNKLRAKLATPFGKPGGVFRLTAANWHELLDRRPTSALWGIGKKIARRLEFLGIRTVAELAAADEERLARAFGPNTGPWLRRLATGEVHSHVTAEPHVARGRGHERTFQENIEDLTALREEIRKLIRELTEELVKEDPRPIVRVVVKVRFASFFTATHGVKVEPPAQLAEDADKATDALERAALEALDRFDLDRPVRLLGVRTEFA
ncbi:MAG TPA: DNA polymerase IV [Actinomycetota bacterium]|nr:DNA polymerase IV [Actinomycetota bacterium]